MAGSYQNFNVWDRLDTCVIGQVWDPEYYHWVKNPAIRSAMEKISSETNDDLQGIVDCLKKLGVNVFRPTVDYHTIDNVQRPPIDAHDHLCMLGDTLIVQSEYQSFYKSIINHVSDQGNPIIDTTDPSFCGAMLYQFDNKIVVSQDKDSDFHQQIRSVSNKPVHQFHQSGHIDGWFCPVTPGLIISSSDPVRPDLMKLFYKTHFPNWEVIYLDPTVDSIREYQGHNWKKYWLAGEEKNNQLLDFINKYLSNWVGNIAETVFEVNMLVVDSNNVLLSRYNKHIFNRLEKYGVTPHLCQHRYDMFWDSGLSCITADLNRNKI